MTRKTDRRNQNSSDLRQWAEEMLRGKEEHAPENLESLSLESLQSIVHELRVHQVELENQNEELRRVQDELEKERASYLDLYEQAPVGYVTINEMGMLLKANLTTVRLLGVTRSFIVSRNISRFIFKDDQDIHYLHIKRLLATGEPQSYELRMVKPNASPGGVWMQLEAILGQEEADELFDHRYYRKSPGAMIRIALSDISGRKLAEEVLQYRNEELEVAQITLKNEKQQMEAVLESLTVGVAITNMQGKIIRTNNAFERLWGKRSSLPRIAEQEHSYEAWWADTGKLVEPEEWASARAVTTRAPVVGQQMKIHCYDDSYAYIINNASPIRDFSGVIVGSVVAQQDITELNRVEKSLRQAHDELELRVLERTEELAVKNRELHILSQKLVDTQENERRHLSRELHDEAGQMLTALLIDLGLLEKKISDPADLLKIIADMEKKLTQVFENLHELAVNLRPASLGLLGLGSVLKNYVETVGAKNGFIVSFTATNINCRLQEDVEIVLYRVVQEALTNVIRHAHATRVDVRLIEQDDQFVTIVEDDGIGFDVDAALAGNHLGLFGIRERIDLIGAELAIESSPGKGSRLIVKVDYPSGVNSIH